MRDVRVERAVLMVWRTEIMQPDVRITLDVLRQRHGHSRLANPRLPGEQHHPPLTAFRLLPAAQQQVELFVAPDQRCGLRTQCFKAADDATVPDHAPGALRLGKTGEWLRSKIFDLKQATNLAAGAPGNDERARSCECLQPGGEVWCLADHTSLLRGTRTDQIADYDEPARNAEPHIQRLGG